MSLEDNTLPKLELYLRNWKRYLDDTFAYFLPDKIDMILHELSSYHPNIKFTYGLESYNKLAFLDVSAIKTNDNKVETLNWKTGTLRNLIKRAKSISSSELLPRNEIGSLPNIFTEYNDFPLKVVNNTIDQELLQSAQ